MDAKTTAAYIIAEYISIVKDLTMAKACALHHAESIQNEYDIDVDPGKHILWKEVVNQIKSF